MILPILANQYLQNRNDLKLYYKVDLQKLVYDLERWALTQILWNLRF